MSPLTVAVVGGGPGGIIAARWCLKEGLVPTVFESTSKVGGHWSDAKDSPTGVFDRLLTNIPYYECALTDVLPIRNGPNPEHGPYSSLFQRPYEFREYLEHVIDSTEGLSDCFQANTKVVNVRRSGERYAVTTEHNATSSTIEYDRVIVANSRTQVPRIPDIEGIENFQGVVMHSRDYRGPEQFTGKSVLVVGGSLSGTECAGDLADTEKGEGPSSVMFMTRCMKHFVGKQLNGRSFTSVMFNPITSQLVASGARTAHEEVNRLRGDFERYFNTNINYDLEPPAPKVFSYVVSQSFLDAAKAGTKMNIRIGCIHRITDDGDVEFNDGSVHQFDAIVFGTGFNIDLSMFGAETEAFVRVSKEYERSGVQELDLYLQTWHSQLPGLAFLGQYVMYGSALMLLDLQARMIARCFAEGEPSKEEVFNGMQEQRMKRSQSGYVTAELVSPIMFTFAEKAGCGIDYGMYPKLVKSLLCGPLVPMQFAICGRFAVEDPELKYRHAVRLAGIDVDKVEVSNAEAALLRDCVAAFKKNGNMPTGFEQAVDSCCRK